MLGLAQTLAWASSYYLPAVLAGAIGRDIGTSASTIFGAFSVALLVAAAVGPYAGRLIDRLGGRPVLIASNLVFAAGLALLSQANTTIHVFGAWAVMGLAMGSGLYESAFATVVRLHGADARRAITGITLLAGFASTVGWPLSTYLESTVGWRGACLAWAAMHIIIGLPLNALLPRVTRVVVASKGTTTKDTAGAGLSPAQRHRTALLMAIVFALTWFNSTAMAAHLPELFLATGATLTIAVGIAALVGPAQVAGRLIDFIFLRRAHPLLSARLATLAHPLGALCLGLFGTSAAAAFAVLHGVGNGILTIAIGTLPLMIFGAKGYGERQGFLMVPARVVQAAAPFVFGLAVEGWGVASLWVSVFLSLAACLALAIMTALINRSKSGDTFDATL
ncbi:MFS transporter [Schauerella aestuarii]|uniref:MFS transporter n=1 Tax=Schauerella aestuarii TaxID=2511204 RepID=UPI00136AB869|nr:MFS transporter [Achromobacter aestuarii]MYZ42530.1 MFS transporter [Achromobacter aestuarii]